MVSLQGFGAPFAAALHYRLAFEIFVVLTLISAVVSRNLNKPAGG